MTTAEREKSVVGGAQEEQSGKWGTEGQDWMPSFQAKRDGHQSNCLVPRTQRAVHGPVPVCTPLPARSELGTEIERKQQFRNVHRNLTWPHLPQPIFPLYFTKVLIHDRLEIS